MRSVVLELSTRILHFPRALKRGIALGVDVSSCVLAFWFALYLRLGEFVPLSSHHLIAVSVSILVALPVFSLFGLHRAIFRHSGSLALQAVGRAIGVYGLIYLTVISVVGVTGVPRTVGLIQPLVLLILVGLSRIFARVLLGNAHRKSAHGLPKIRALIYGAGFSGRSLSAALDSNPKITILGYLDDDKRLHKNVLNGRTVYSPEDLDSLLEKLNVTHIILAMPSLKRSRRNEILDRLRRSRVAVQTVSTFFDSVSKGFKSSDVGELDIDDLLGRAVVSPNRTLLSKNVTDKIVLVTGSGGSIGSELCRQIIGLMPKKLLLVENSEYALYTIHEELLQRANLNKIALVPLLSSVQDGNRIRRIMETWKPNTVYHAAAYKHVPLVESNPLEGIRNNVFGTLCVAEAAIENKISDFVLVSTDKAVRPTNVMGATKRMAEMVIQRLSKDAQHTKLSMVRFGNVLGSSGSVVPKFRKQINQGGPITLTHPAVTRFFMSIPEAAQLVIQAGAISNGGDVFVLDMGGPVKIFDLAVRMVELSGLSVRDDANKIGDIEIKIVGLRPAEKLHEELLIDGDSMATIHPKISRAIDEKIDSQDFDKNLELMRLAVNAGNTEDALRLLRDIVMGYSSPDGNLDLLHLEQIDLAR